MTGEAGDSSQGENALIPAAQEIDPPTILPRHGRPTGHDGVGTAQSQSSRHLVQDRGLLPGDLAIRDHASLNATFQG